MARVASSVGSESPLPPPVSPSKYDTSARSTSLSPSIAMAKYGPLSLRHGHPMPSASTPAATPPMSAASGHDQPADAMRMAPVYAPAPKKATWQNETTTASAAVRFHGT